MSHSSLRRAMSLLVLSIMTLVPAAVWADDPLVFITAFAPGDKGAIHAYRLNGQSGSLKLAHTTTGVENPFFLALSPDRKFMYSIHAKQFGGKEPEQVAAYELVGRDGALKLLNRQSAHGTAACYLHVDSSGKSVLVSNYSSGNIASLPVNADGSLGEAASVIQHAGENVDPKKPVKPHAHCIVVAPNNRFALVADLGLNQVLSYRLDASTAKLAPAEPPFVKSPDRAGPRHLVYHPQKPLVYVINETGNSVSVYQFNAETGALREQQTISTLPSDFTGKSYCADLKFAANGRFLYGTNRGHDSIACYRVADDGQLSLIEIIPSLGKGPQNLVVVEPSNLLLCANMPGNNVAVFRLDPASGKLSAIGDPMPTPSPSCIMLLP